MPGAGTQPYFTGKMSFTTQMSKANYAAWWVISFILPIIAIKLEKQICHINDLRSYARRHPIASKRFAKAISCQWQLCIASQLTIEDARVGFGLPLFYVFLQSRYRKFKSMSLRTTTPCSNLFIYPHNQFGIHRCCHLDLIFGHVRIYTLLSYLYLPYA